MHEIWRFKRQMLKQRVEKLREEKEKGNHEKLFLCSNTARYFIKLSGGTFE